MSYRQRWVGFCGFAAVAALFTLASSKAGMRGLGVLMLVHAGKYLKEGSIPYGWEGREPSGYITGIGAILLGVLIGLLGVAMLVSPDLMLRLFGWSDE